MISNNEVTNFDKYKFGIPLSMVVASDLTGVIGYRNKLPWGKIHEDMSWFREITANKILIVGSKTWQSMINMYNKNANTFRNRFIIVISDKSHKKDNANQNNILYIRSFDSIVDIVKSLIHNNDSIYDISEIMVIGGKSIYEQLFDYINTIYLTEIFDYDNSVIKDKKYEVKCKNLEIFNLVKLFEPVIYGIFSREPEKFYNIDYSYKYHYNCQSIIQNMNYISKVHLIGNETYLFTKNKKSIKTFSTNYYDENTVSTRFFQKYRTVNDEGKKVSFGTSVWKRIR